MDSRRAVRPLERVGLGRVCGSPDRAQLDWPWHRRRTTRPRSTARVDRLRDEFASGETDRVQRAARRWLERLPQHSEIVSVLAAADTPEFVLASRVPGLRKRCKTQRKSSGGPPPFKASRLLRDPLACNGRADGWLVRRAADTAGRSAAWAAPSHYGDAVIATEDGLGCGDGCRCGDRRECRHSCDGVASVAATLGGRRRRCRGGSPPHVRAGARSRSGLFADIARIARPRGHHRPHARSCAVPTNTVAGPPKSISDHAESGCWHWLGPRICASSGGRLKEAWTMSIELPHEYQPSEDEEFMSPRQVQYFRRRLEQSRADLRRELAAGLPSDVDDSSREGDQTDHASAASEREFAAKNRERIQGCCGKRNERF